MSKTANAGGFFVVAAIFPAALASGLPFLYDDLNFFISGGNLMDVSEFYSLFSATCFALVGLWWNVVEKRQEWFKDEAMKTIAGGVYLSFLLPGLMGLGAQIGGENGFLWRLVFAVGAGFGIFYTLRLLDRTKNGPFTGPFRRNRWLVIAIYAFILLGSLGFDAIFGLIGIQPLQVEAFWLCLIILLGHGLAWDFLTQPKADLP